ncbi:MAG: tetratricopeptide repeat protein [Gammaproteobacteria bacterium]|nr:tetratricopeptide repeat protein [Gammaproteobacteria bacterium]
MRDCKDKRGIAYTAATQEAVDRFDATMEEYLHFGTDAGPRLKETLSADPEFAMAHVLRGYFMQLFCVAALTEKAAQSLAKAREAAAARGVDAREQHHIDALAAWIGGDMRSALDHWESILLEHPLDMLAVKLAQFTLFYLGDSRRLRDCIARILYAWSADVPGRANVLGMYAFGLEESGDYESAERYGREAVASDPDDAWAVHAVAHVLEMQDRRRDGIDWLRGLESHWRRANNFRFHIWWHLALFHLELEQHEEVLRLYDEEFRAESTEEYLDVCNATSMLWRLEERGVDVGDRWKELSEVSATRTDGHGLIFPDMHFMMALEAAGDRAGGDRMLRSLEEMAGRPGVTQAQVVDAVGLELARAIAAWYRDDYEGVIARLLPIRYALSDIGGSHAQRDLFQQMLIAAALRAPHAKLARALLAERTRLKPRNAWTWQRYSQALEAAGDGVGAREAAREARSLLAA